MSLPVLVLAVEGDERLGELAQIGHRRGAAVDERARAALRADAPREDDLLRVLRQALAQLAAQRVRQLEHALDVRLLGAGPDDAGPRPAAEQQIERVGQHRLARAGLPRQDVEPRREAQLGLLDQQEVLDAELVEHARWSTSAPRRIGPVCNRLVTRYRDSRPNFSRSLR